MDARAPLAEDGHLRANGASLCKYGGPCGPTALRPEPAAPAVLAGSLRELSFLVVSNCRCCAPTGCVCPPTGCVCPSLRLTACPTPAGDDCKGRKRLEMHVTTRSQLLWPGGLAGTPGLALSHAGRPVLLSWFCRVFTNAPCLLFLCA